MSNRFGGLLVIFAVCGLFIVALMDAAAGSLPSQTGAGQEVPSGAAVFKSYCSSCHGTTAKGDGPLAEHLKRRPADLTQFAKRNAGKFDADVVYRIIDGRNPVGGHGGGDMPVWGDAFAASREGSTPEAVKQRITAIVKYLEALQQN